MLVGNDLSVISSSQHFPWRFVFRVKQDCSVRICAKIRVIAMKGSVWLFAALRHEHKL